MSPWEELGISPTTDSGVIRKAYAGRLKQNKPEDDQEGFKRLRAAYEIALVLAARAVQHGHQAVVPAASTTSLFNPVGVKRREEASPPPISTPPTKDAGGNLDPESQAALQSILAAFSHQDGESAARLIESAIDRNLLPLAVELGLSERLVSVLLNDGSMPAKRLLEIAKRFGWYGVPDALRGRNGWMEHRLCSRIDAELWLAELRRRAKDFTFFLGGHTAGAARLLLGKGLIIFARIAPPEPPLRMLTAQLELHYPWIASHFDETRIKQVRQLVKPGHMALYTIVALFVALLVALGASATVPAAGAAVGAVFFLLVYRLRKFARPLLLGTCGLLLWIGLVGSLGPASSPASVHRSQDLASGPGPPVPGPSLGQNTIDMLIQRATAGDAAAQQELGFAYATGRGVPVDGARALRWRMAAARQGAVNAMNDVGYAYMNGFGVPRDVGKAFSWFQAAADSGQPNAMHSLGQMYAGGGGIIPDLANAYRWLSLAVRTFPAGSAKLASARQELQYVSSIVPDKLRADIDRELQSWKPGPAAPPLDQ